MTTTHAATFLQRRLYRAALGGISHDVVECALRIRPPVSDDALLDALSRIAERHESLRTSLGTRDGAVVQLVHPSLRLERRPGPVASSPSDLSRTRAALANRPFDLTRHQPLVRAAVLARAKSDMVLCLCVHHAVFDDASREVLANQLAAALGGPLPTSAKRPFQMRELAASEASNPSPVDREFWHAALAHRDAGTRFARASSLPYELGWSPPRVLDPGTVERVRALSAGTGVTRAVTYRAALGLVLTLGGLRPPILGVLVANRDDASRRSMIGCVFDCVPVVVRLADRTSFRDALVAVRDQTGEALAHRIPTAALASIVGSGALPGVTINHLPRRRVARRDEGDSPSVELLDNDLQTAHRRARFNYTGSVLDVFVVERDRGVVEVHVGVDVNRVPRACAARLTRRLGDALARLSAHPDESRSLDRG